MNHWYEYTYETILGLANWASFDVEVDRKMVGIFSWMPQTVMMLKYKGGRHRCEIFSLTDVQTAATAADVSVFSLDGLTLQDMDIDSHSAMIAAAYDPMMAVLGSVTTSKYLHFSRPHLFPMWDRKIRLSAGFDEDASGYIDFMRQFKTQLEDAENLKNALLYYPKNAVRGWDKIQMENR